MTAADIAKLRGVIAKLGDCAGPLTTFPKPGVSHVTIVCRDNWDDVIRWLAAMVAEVPVLLDALEAARDAKRYGEKVIAEVVHERDALRIALEEACDLAEEANGDPSSCSYNVPIGARIAELRATKGTP